MEELIRKMAETEASVEWFRIRNAELQKTLQNITVNGPNYGGIGGSSGPGDPVGRTVTDREKMSEEMQINSRSINERLAHFARLSAVMGECLSKDERKVIWAKYGDRLPWERVSRMARMSRSTCIRLADRGMEKLCYGWDKCPTDPENEQKQGN
jgi:hypothetical protein